MKKFFGIVGLIFCVFLSSCNFSNFSDKTGSLEFSIPVNDIIRLNRQYASRNGYGNEEPMAGTLYVYVQLKGNKKYYTVQKRQAVLDKNGNLTEYSQLPGLLDGNLSFEFPDIPSSEKYTVAVDMIFSPTEEETPNGHNKALTYRFLTGKSEDVRVYGGRTKEVKVKASFPKKSIISLKADYENGKSKTLDSLFSFLFDEQHNLHADNNFLDITVNNNVLLDEDIKSILFAPNVIKDVSLVLDSSCLFDENCTYTLNYSAWEGRVLTVKSRDLVFNNNICSIKDFILENMDNQVSMISISVKSSVFEFEEPAPAVYFSPSYGNPEYAKTGIKKNLSLIFNKDEEDSPTGKSRWVCKTALSSIMGSDTLADGDTLVFILNTNNEFNNSFNSDNEAQFYYMIGNAGATLKFDNCITFDKESDNNYYFVMPLNQISGSDNSDQLIMFFDTTEAGDNSITITGDIKYYHFPSSQSAFVFMVGKSYNANQKYRYETKIPTTYINMQQPPVLQQDDIVKISIY